MILAVMTTAIEVRGLRKRYGEFEAVRGIDFSVRRGEVFGLLGPNGAGKTTTVEILEGYRERTAGEVERARPRPRSCASAPCASGWGSCCRAAGSTGTSRSARRWRTGPASTPAPATWTRSIALAGLERQGRRAHAPPLRRPAAPARLRARAGRRPRADLPGRADHRLRPGGAAQRVGDRPVAARRSARPCCSPRTTSTRPRRSPTAWRSSRTGAILAEGPPGELGRGASRYRVTWRDGDGAARRARDRRPDDAAARADRRGAGARRAARGPHGHPPVARGRLPGADRRCMSVAGLTWRQYRLERRMFWRNPSAAFFNFLLPLLFLALFGADLLRQPDGPRRDRARHRRAWRDVDDVHRARLQHDVPARAGDPQAHARHAAAVGRLPARDRAQRGDEHGGPGRDHHRRGQGVLRRRLAAGLARARRVRRSPGWSASPRSGSRCRTRSRTSTRRPPT